MVRQCYFIVDLGGIRLPFFGAEDVVDTHKHTGPMIGKTRAVTARHVAIREVFGQPLMRV